MKEPEDSINTEDSAKAKYFLNKARKALLEKTGKDDYLVSSVKVNAMSLPLELSTERFPFETEVKLAEGLNKIKVVAEDLTGNTVENILGINVDRQGPTVIVEGQQHSNGKVKEKVIVLEAGDAADIIDVTPPFIKLKEMAGSQTIYNEKILIEGSASDNSKIRSL